MRALLDRVVVVEGEPGVRRIRDSLPQLVADEGGSGVQPPQSAAVSSTLPITLTYTFAWLRLGRR